MRGSLIFIAVLLWLGASATVVVSWSSASLYHSALNPNRMTRWTDSTTGHVNGWYVFQRHRIGAQLRYLRPIVDSSHVDPFPADGLPSWSNAHRPATEAQPRILEQAHGWPFVSLRCTWIESDDAFSRPQDWVRGGIVIEPYLVKSIVAGGGFAGTLPPESHYVTERYAIPLQPIWFGLVASTAFWMICIGTLVLIPLTVRRMWWRFRGNCIQCAYPLTPTRSTRCPECGWDRSARAPLVTRGRIITSVIIAGLLTLAAAGIATHGVRGFEDLPPLHVAARYNDADRIQRLLAQGEFIDQQLDRQWWYPHSWMRRLPLDNEIRQSTPLMWAAAHGNLDAMTVLLQHGADPDVATATNDGMFTAVCAAAKYSQVDAIQHLLDSGADMHIVDVNNGPASPLIYAARYSSPDLVQKLIDAGAFHVSEFGYSTGTLALYWAAHNGRKENVQVLLDAGVNVDGKFIITYSDECGEHEMPQQLPESPLVAAIRNNHDDAVRLLVKHGADIAADEATKMLFGAIHHASKDIIRVLLDAGADPNVRHRRGTLSPIVHAVLHNDLELAQLLIDAGTKPMYPWGDDESSILFQLRSFVPAEDVAEWVRLFSTADGVVFNYQDAHGNTALITAVARRHEELVRALLDAGADPRIENSLGLTALDYAQRPPMRDLSPDAPLPETVRDHRDDDLIRMLREALDRYE